jgi:methyltransferase family protein
LPPPKYSLGSADLEIARLDRQAESIAGATDALLRASGIGPGMRVLDVGTGLGHVAFHVASLVGPTGSVVGVDQDARLLGVAEGRRAAAGAENMRFLEADARTVRFDEPFDAFVCRLLLFHLPDAADVLRHHRAGLRPGGLAVTIDYDTGASRTEPPVPLLAQGLGWVEAAFRAAGADPRIGARLGVLLRESGFADVQTLGIQAYFGPTDPAGVALLAGVVRALAPAIVAGGIATEEEIGLDTLEERLAREVEAADAVVLTPTVVGAWGQRYDMRVSEPPTCPTCGQPASEALGGPEHDWECRNEACPEFGQPVAADEPEAPA